VKYIVQVEIDPDTGVEFEETPEEIQKWVGEWQKLNPIGMYFSMTRRAVTIIVDALNEDEMLEALHATWLITRSYPEVWPVVDQSELGGIMQRLLV